MGLGLGLGVGLGLGLELGVGVGVGVGLNQRPQRLRELPSDPIRLRSLELQPLAALGYLLGLGCG